MKNWILISDNQRDKIGKRGGGRDVYGWGHCCRTPGSSHTTPRINTLSPICRILIAKPLSFCPIYLFCWLKSFTVSGYIWKILLMNWLCFQKSHTLSISKSIKLLLLSVYYLSTILNRDYTDPVNLVIWYR